MLMNKRKVSVAMALVVLSGLAVAEVNSGTGAPEGTESGMAFLEWLLAWWTL